ncbi:glycosyltransferase family 4 protein [Xanthobacter autotrophicus]|uniref:glycosyltransferase family 4 protein n=1 Tax=Xanthobacter autotrophicus TaxID=280 RepID=UPI0037271941
MKIFIYAPHFAEYSIRMALALSDKGRVGLAVDRQNFALECTPDLQQRARSRLELVPFRSRGRVQRWASLPQLVARILSFRPDVVHVQEQTDDLTVRVVSLVEKFHPIVLTVHDPKPHRGADAAWAIRMTKYRERLRDMADVFHVHGAVCQAELASTLSRPRPIVPTCHGAILVPTDEQRRDPERRRLLMFGRMEAYKGLEVLLDAVKILEGRGIDFRLVLAGRGSELDRLADRIRSCASIEVIAGFLAPWEAVDEFQKAGIVVAPYLEATQSGVVAAAFGNGRPVVASRTGGLVDAVCDGRSGLLVPPGDPLALAEALERLLADAGAWRRLLAGAQEEAVDSFSWSHVSAVLEEAYSSLVREWKA